jgi:hypothetical protein
MILQTRDLIAELQRLDPSGHAEVCVGVLRGDDTEFVGVVEASKENWGRIKIVLHLEEV